jgi:hypothetical protein
LIIDPLAQWLNDPTRHVQGAAFIMLGGKNVLLFDRITKHNRQSKCSEEDGHCCRIHHKEQRKGCLVANASDVMFLSQTSHIKMK